MMVKKKKTDHDDEINADDVELTDNVENAENKEDRSQGSISGESEESGTPNGKNADKPVVEVINFEEKLAEMQDRYLRLSAEFDNYRKRTLREKIELTKYASENIMGKIIPLMDDFERALKHTEDPESMKTGMSLIYEKFSGFLKQNGVKEIEAMNQEFNVDVHEAVAKVTVQEAEQKGKIVDVISKGYFLQDKVLRFSKVVVGE